MANPQAQAPNFFSVVNEMAARFVELMKSDYKMPRRVNGKTRNRYASGTLYNSLAYRLQIKGKSIGVSVFAKGKASKYFLAMEDGRRAGAKQPPVSAILEWMKIKPIRLRDNKGSFVKATESMKRHVAFLIARKIGKDGIKGWKAFDYAMENIWDEYSEKLFDAYGKDFNGMIDDNFE